MKRVVVVGGGISGLSTAWLLQDAAKTAGVALEVTVLEQADQTGGKIRSTREAGFLCEWGPNGFLDSKPHTLDLCTRLGIAHQLLRSNDTARKRFIYSEGQLHQLPHNGLSFLKSSLLSLPGKLRLLAEPFAKPSMDPDESLADFGRRRLGDEALRKLIAPMASGIFAGDPDRMSLRSCFPRIAELEEQYGGLFKAMIQLARQKKKDAAAGKVSGSAAGPGGVLTSFKPGIQFLTDTLARSLGSQVVTGVSVESLTKTDVGWCVKGSSGIHIEADSVILAVPAYEAAQITRPIDAGLSEVLTSIPYSPLKVVCFGYETAGLGHDLDGFGYLVPKEERRTVLGTLWDSSMFESRAPEGYALVRSMVGGACRPELASCDAGEIEELVRQDIQQIMGITRAPSFVKTIEHQQAIPHYTVGHGQRLVQINSLLKKYQGLFLTGNAFKGVGLNDCVLASWETADSVLAELQSCIR